MHLRIHVHALDKSYPDTEEITGLTIFVMAGNGTHEISLPQKSKGLLTTKSTGSSGKIFVWNHSRVQLLDRVYYYTGVCLLR